MAYLELAARPHQLGIAEVVELVVDEIGVIAHL